LEKTVLLWRERIAASTRDAVVVLGKKKGQYVRQAT